MLASEQVEDGDHGILGGAVAEIVVRLDDSKPMAQSRIVVTLDSGATADQVSGLGIVRVALEQGGAGPGAPG